MIDYKSTTGCFSYTIYMYPIRENKHLIFRITACCVLLIFYVVPMGLHAELKLATKTVPPLILLLKTALTANELALVVNDDDPDSVEVAGYYQLKRHIPKKNIIHVRFKAGTSTLSKQPFLNIKTEVDSHVSESTHNQTNDSYYPRRTNYHH